MAKKTIEQRIQNLEDLREVENLMGTYAYLHTAGRHADVAKLFAQKTPGVRLDLMGVYEGLDGVQRGMVQLHEQLQAGLQPGILFMHTQTTPVIVVAGDGKTAKGVWQSPGFETRKDFKTGKFYAYWLWSAYGVDFVKEDGKWKFWHFHIYPMTMAPVGKSWTDPPSKELDNIITAEMPKPDRPTRYDSGYSTTKEIKFDPAPPQPYETFDEKDAY